MGKIGRPIIYSEQSLLNLVEKYQKEQKPVAWGTIRNFSKFAGISERNLRRKASVIRALRCSNLIREQAAPVCLTNPSAARGSSTKQKPKPKTRSDFWS